MTNASKLIHENPLWKGCSEEEIKMAINQVERNLMVSLYDR
jgi:hypothetical protein